MAEGKSLPWKHGAGEEESRVEDSEVYDVFHLNK